MIDSRKVGLYNLFWLFELQTYSEIHKSEEHEDDLFIISCVFDVAFSK